MVRLWLPAAIRHVWSVWAIKNASENRMTELEAIASQLLCFPKTCYATGCIPLFAKLWLVSEMHRTESNVSSFWRALQKWVSFAVIRDA